MVCTYLYVKNILGEQVIKFIKKAVIIYLIAALSLSTITPSENSSGEKSTTKIIMGYSILVFLDTNPMDANAAIVIWADVLIKLFREKYNLDTELIATVFNTMEEMEEALAKKNVDMVVLTSSEYFLLKDQYKLEPALAGVIDENFYSQYIMLTHNDSKINSVTELSRKSLSQPKDKLNPLLLRWLNKLLADNNKPQREQFFSKISFEEKDANAVYSLFFKRTDCAIVQKNVFNTVCELNPQIGKALKIIASSPPIILSLATYRKDSDTTSVKLFYDVAKNINTIKEGTNILKLFKTKRLIEVTEKDLESTKKLLLDLPVKKQSRK